MSLGSQYAILRETLQTLFVYKYIFNFVNVPLSRDFVKVSVPRIKSTLFWSSSFEKKATISINKFQIFQIAFFRSFIRFWPGLRLMKN